MSAPLKVLQAHGYYREPGGEDASFDAECALLEAHGHPVVRFVRRNREIDGYRLPARAGLALATIWSGRARRALVEVLRRERPALAHFQNTFPLLSPAVYSACRAEGVPVVQTLRNYRLLCPAATFFRDGRVCTDCAGKGLPWPGVAHGCYRGSRLQSGVVAAMLGVHNALGTWSRQVDLFIALSEFSRRTFVAAGLAPDRISVKPNFIADPGEPSAVPPGGPILFVGRLAPEKGVEDLIRAAGRLGWIHRLRIAGGGPERARLEGLAREHGGEPTLFAGPLPAAGVIEEMRRASCVVVPSRWYETFGRVVAEAFACGRPAIVSRIGALAELVGEGRTGALFEPGDPESLAEAIERTLADPVRLAASGREARAEYEEKYAAGPNYGALLAIYRRVLEAGGGARSSG